MTAEKEKEKTKEELITELRSDKLQLQQQVAQLGELLKLQAQKEEKKAEEVKPGKTLNWYHCKKLDNDDRLDESV